MLFLVEQKVWKDPDKPILADAVIDVAARNIARGGNLKTEDKMYIDMLEKLGRLISARANLGQIWLPTPVSPSLRPKVSVPSWDVGTSSSSDCSFSNNDLSLTEIFPSPKQTSNEVSEEESSEDETPFFLQVPQNSGTRTNKNKKRRRSHSDPGLRKTPLIKSEPPPLEDLPQPEFYSETLEPDSVEGKKKKRVTKGLVTPKVSDQVKKRTQVPQKKKKVSTDQKGTSGVRKGCEKTTEVSQAKYGKIRSALVNKKKENWGLDEILRLRDETRELVRELAQKALDDAPTADRKALGVILDFD